MAACAGCCISWSSQGQYFIYDLPEFVALQRYFLKSIGMPVRDGAPDEASSRNLPFH